jgi:hypothetical protein
MTNYRNIEKALQDQARVQECVTTVHNEFHRSAGTIEVLQGPTVAGATKLEPMTALGYE